MKADQTDPVRPASERKGIASVLLAAGAKGLQTHKALRGFDAYVVGFHCAKEVPHKQMEAHHFCKQLSADLLQCLIFDGEGADANLVGVEYIVSERLFAGLPDDERALWHPHNYELLAGQLVAPGLPVAAEKALVKLLLNSYGKTWHLWDIGVHTAAPGATLPVGGAHLMWSFNQDGQLDATLERQRNKRLDISIDQKRREREELIPEARPQEGVDLLTRSFGELQRPYPGVKDVHAVGDAE